MVVSLTKGPNWCRRGNRSDSGGGYYTPASAWNDPKIRVAQPVSCPERGEGCLSAYGLPGLTRDFLFMLPSVQTLWSYLGKLSDFGGDNYIVPTNLGQYEGNHN